MVHRAIALAFCFSFVIAARPSPAHAEIETRIVLVLGVKLSAAQATAANAKHDALAKGGIVLFADPSMSWGSPPAKVTTYAGRVLADKVVDRTANAAPAAIPTQAA